MLAVKKNAYTRDVPIFQRIIENAQGGFTLDTTGLVIGSIIPGGTAIGYNEATRKASLLKTATLQANASNTDTGYKVLKGHLLKQGDVLTSALKTKAYTVQSVDTSNAAYDTVTLNTTLGVALTAGAVLMQAAAEVGTNTSSFVVAPKGLLYENTEVQVGQDLAVLLRGTAYARRIPGATDDIKSAMPLIIFSQSY